MSQVYTLINFGASPVSLIDMKTFLKVTTTSDDVLIQSLIDSATEWGEKYTGREFRANQWKLLLDIFSERIELRRDPVDVVDSITRLVDESPITVSTINYYLKKLTQRTEILLFNDKSWPTDADDREQAIEVNFTTKAYRCLNEIINAIKLHAANLYINRGDCPDSEEAAKKSGATLFYEQFRIVRI